MAGTSFIEFANVFYTKIVVDFLHFVIVTNNLFRAVCQSNLFFIALKSLKEEIQFSCHLINDSCDIKPVQKVVIEVFPLFSKPSVHIHDLDFLRRKKALHLRLPRALPTIMALLQRQLNVLKRLRFISPLQRLLSETI
jgi:hypothetical protein